MLCTCAYIALTRQNAKLLLWPAIKLYNETYELNLVMNVSDLTVTFPNGSVMILGGAGDKAQIDKFRGFFYKLVVIDEAQSFKMSIIQELIEDVLEAALIDQRGTLCLTGTPNAACIGYFHDATNIDNDQWSVHKWTLLDNPNIIDAKGYLEEKKRQKDWDDNNPILCREYKGLWVRSADHIIYDYSSKRNLCESLPSGFQAQHILGVDIGFDDAMAFLVFAFDTANPVVYVVDCFKKSKMDTDEINEKTVQLTEKFNFFNKKVIDTGGLGKFITNDINTRFGHNFESAEKKAKHAYIELINADFRTGRIKIVNNKANQELIEELQVLQWNEDKTKEDEGFENHLCDAMLYAWRECLHWVRDVREKEYEADSPEWFKKKEQEMLEQAKQGIIQQHDIEDDWGEYSEFEEF